MAVLSLTNLLRIGEAWTICSPRDDKLCVMGQKSRSGEHEQDLGPWASCWMRFRKEERQKRGVAEEPTWVSVMSGLGRGKGGACGGHRPRAP